MCGNVMHRIDDISRAAIRIEKPGDIFVGPATGESLKHTKQDLTDLGLKKEKRPPADPAAERAAADAAATTLANARIAFQRKAMRENSLLTGGGQTAAAAGRSTLGV